VLATFRPGTMEGLGLGFEQLRQVKRDIILRCTAFGEYVPCKDRPSFDPLGEA